MKTRANLAELPLDWIFSAPSHIGIIRTLSVSQVGMSGRSIARLAGLNHQSCAVAIRKLETVGILERIRSGKTQLIRLNFHHYLIQEALLPLIRSEKNMYVQMRKEIVHAFQSHALTATLFGSAARRQLAPGSDIDLLLIAHPSTRNKSLEMTRAFAVRFHQKYGMRLSSLVFTLEEARKRIRKGDPLFQNIFRESVDVFPRKLEDVLP